MIGTLWSKDRIVDAIQRRHQEGKAITANATNVEDGALVAAASRHFGGWGKALKAAGIVG